MNDKIKFLIIGLLIGIAVACGLFFIIYSPEKEYKVTFDTVGGSVIESQIVKKGGKAVRPINPTKEDNTFVMWTYENQEYDFNREVTNDITLTAKWEEKEILKYDIVFVVDGEEKTLSVSELTEQNLEELGFPSKEGYEIKWYLNDQEYDFSMPITENMRLIGKYEKITEYTVKFNSDGGTSVKSQKVKLNGLVEEPTEITKEGFIFEGWYLNKEKYNFNTPVTKSITLVAKWSEDPNVKRYEVKFDSNGGSKVSTQRVIENKKASEPKKPTRSGYVFVEWQLNSKKDNFNTKVTKSITLKAKGEKSLEYTVTFDSNGGSKVDSQKVKQGDKAIKPKDPIKSGYKFVEWILNNSTYDFSKSVTSNITLTARYEKIKETSTPTPTPTSTVDKYTITATKADNMASPDSILKVYKNGQQISVKEIQYNDGHHLCDGSKLVVNTNDIKGESTLIVVLNNGTKVKATLK